ncbi:MAG TPA: 2,3-dihydro-2,3-dihydroxybenzoate dehydrogenase [Micromonosporaceae bacterium]|nr:2,3-dihydro-2,3-dihydroxybenzoate dehydrogenase [Micromonosporaceae bacterium]
MSQYPDCSGKVALVTGAAGGIGAAVANALAAEGAQVAAVDRDADPLELLVKAAHSESRAITAYPLDITDRNGVWVTVERIERELGPVSLLVNAAGVLHPSDTLSTTDTAWDSTIAVNATGVFGISRAVAGRMVPRRDGAIVTVASNAAGVPRSGMAAYAASKAAATAFTRCLGLELAKYGIRCNVVAPGSTDTPMFHGLFSVADPVAKAIAGDPATYRVGIPLGRIAEPSDVADTVLFLLSKRARHITMQTVYVDGGAALGG